MTKFILPFCFVLFGCSNTSKHSTKFYAQAILQYQQYYMDSVKGDRTMIEKIKSDEIITSSLLKFKKQNTNSLLEDHRGRIVLQLLNKDAKTYSVKFYHDDQKYSLQFLDTLLHIFEITDLKQKRKSNDKQIELINSKIQLLNDSLEVYETKLLSAKNELEGSSGKDIELESLKKLKHQQRQYELTEKMYLFYLEKKTALVIKQAGFLPSFDVLEKPKIVINDTE